TNGGPAAHIAPTPKPKFDPVQAFRNSFLGKQSENDDPAGSVSRRKGKEKALPARNDSMERMNQSKLSAKAIEIREWLQGKSGTGTNRTTLDANRETGNGQPAPLEKDKQLKMGSIRNLFKNRRPAPPPKDRGPKPGQTYEIIDRRVVENNPERTVEISTWREQTVKRTKSNEDESMSIYFLSADEYPQEGEYANSTMARVEWKIDTPDVTDHSRIGSSRSGNIQKSTNVSEKAHQTIKEATLPVRREGTISPSTSEKDVSSAAKAIPIQVRVQEVDSATPGSSTPCRIRPPACSRQRGRYKNSSQGDKELPRSPYHPTITRSGSTISRSRSESAVRFEGVLQSCEPSLIHIASMLRSLGIRKLEHLKAVAKLTPQIRDREIKEDALRLGITVVEWAILLDKVSTL
ncbi:hypothetical protein BJ912DRAFT_996367, partial [Pholiota molesta]